MPAFAEREDRMHGLCGGYLALQSIQEADELLMPVALHVPSEDLAGQRVERRKQRRRSIAFIIMGHGCTPSLLHRQAGLGPPSRACKHALPGSGQVPGFATFHLLRAPPHVQAVPRKAPRHPAISPRRQDPSTV